MADDEREATECLSKCIIVDNTPVAPEALVPKLKVVLQKIFSAYGTIVEEGFSIPVDGGKTVGYTFIEFETPEMAAKAVAEGDNKRLDAKHVLRVTLFNEFEKFMGTDEEYVAPTSNSMGPKVDLSSWLLEKESRDQFVLRFARETLVYWSDPVKFLSTDGRQLCYGGEREKARIDPKTNAPGYWTDLNVTWSLRGSYLTTFHSQGVIVWGGEQFDQIARFSHKGVKVVNFSPNENYLVTSSLEKQQAGGPPSVVIWDLRSAKCLRPFDVDVSLATWPTFKWSHDDKYVCRVRQTETEPKKDVITVYETPLLGTVPGSLTNIEIPGVRDAEWSPAENRIAYWVPERDNAPAKIALLEFPSKQTVRDVHLFNVSDAKLAWHPTGSFLAVRMSKKKAKKVVGTSFVVLRVKERDVPQDSLEIPDSVSSFAWDPTGERFAVIIDKAGKTFVSFYSCAKKIVLLKTIEKPANNIHWAPQGNTVVISALGGTLLFVETVTFEITAEVEHYQCNDVEWDPTGRYVVSSITNPINNTLKALPEGGYRLWTNLGALVTNVSVEGLYRFEWRPRPPSLTDAAHLSKIKNELREKYWKQFEQEDDEIKQRQLTGAEREKQEARQQWKEYRQAKEKEFLEERQMRRELRGGEVSDDDEVLEVEQIFEEEFDVEVVEAPVEAGASE